MRRLLLSLQLELKTEKNYEQDANNIEAETLSLFVYGNTFCCLKEKEKCEADMPRYLKNVHAVDQAMSLLF